MRLRFWLIVSACSVGFGGAITPSTSAAQSAAPLTVRLYNTAHLAAPDLLTARDEAAHILRDTGVAVAFRKCGIAAAAGDAVDVCSETLASSEVVVRLIDAPAFNTTLDPDAYGVTYIVNTTNRGWLATVFADRLRAAATRVDVDPGVLVGRVMAHEIGHLLLGRDYHGNVGVMQAAWTDAMLTRPDDAWRFTMREAERMRQIRSLLQ